MISNPLQVHKGGKAVSARLLTHYSPMLLIYTPWKHQKTFRFTDVFWGVYIDKQHRAVMD